MSRLDVRVGRAQSQRSRGELEVVDRLDPEVVTVRDRRPATTELGYSIMSPRRSESRGGVPRRELEDGIVGGRPARPRAAARRSRSSGGPAGPRPPPARRRRPGCRARGARSAGPMPESSSRCALPMAPAARMTSPALDRAEPVGRADADPGDAAIDDVERQRLAVGHDRQVRPSAHRGGEHRARRAPAQPAFLVERQGPDAHRHRCVVVVGLAIASLEACRGERGLRRHPRLARVAVEPERPVPTVVGIAPVRVGLDRPVRGQDRLPRPGRVDHPRPPLEVLGHAPQEDAAVDGARAAHDAAARDARSSRRSRTRSRCSPSRASRTAR